MKIGRYRVSPYEKVHTIDGVWGDWACEIEDEDGNIQEGYIEGDGGLFEESTLKDKDGAPIKINED